MRQVLFNDIAEIYNGKTPSKIEQRSSGFPVLKIKDIDENGYFRSGYTSFVDNELAFKLQKKILQEFDILVLNAAHNSDYVASKNCIVKREFAGSLATGEWLIIRPSKDKVISKYLFFYINSPLAKMNIKNIVKGIHLYPKDFKNLTVPLPSIEIQKHIAKILDEADCLRQKRKQAISLLDDYLKSIFLEMFGNPMNNPKRWSLKKFIEIGKLDRGISKHRPRNAPELLGGIHPLIQTGDVANSGIFIETFSSTYSDIGLKQSKKWPKGTLCITIAANIAKTGILKFEACFPDSVVGFIADENRTNNEFVHFWISFLQEMLEKSAPESAQKNINLKILRELDVICPPLELQNKFSEIVYKTEFLKQKMLLQMQELDTQFQALMQKSFNKIN